MIRRLLQRLRGCQHANVRNTGDSYTDKQHGFTVVLTECLDCGLVVIREA